MLSLKMYRDNAKGVADLLNYAALIDEGVVQGKDGSLTAGFYYRGPDIASATEGERNYLTTRINAALSRLGDGWATWQDAIRLPAAEYPPVETSHFPDLISKLIDAERRAQFQTVDAHFESRYVLTFTYLPPLQRESKITDLIYSDDPDEAESPALRTLAKFKKAMQDIEDALKDVLMIHRMKGYTFTDKAGREHLRDELVEYLNFTLTGLTHPINIPPDGCYLDAALGGQELWVGDNPKIGYNHIACVTLEGLPGASFPNILEVLENLPIAYRWSSRMIYLDQHQTVDELQKYRRKWHQKRRGFFAQLFHIQGGTVNEDALLMARQAESAITDANSALVTYGYYTPVIVLMGEDRTRLLENARLVVKEIQQEGFSCRIETVNTMEAWLGSLPSHTYQNIRRPMIHTLNLSDLVPLSSVWAGKETSPCPFYPPDSPPLLQAATYGATPFRLNLHVGDVGHTLVFGPTGAGKSTLLGTIVAQFRRYQNASIVCFDKGRSMLTLVEACGGRHYDIAASGSPSFTPLAELDTLSDMAWAEEWICTCYELQVGRPTTPQQREEMQRALKLLRTKNVGERSFTDFNSTVQDELIRAALSTYTVSGSFGFLLDSQDDGLQDSSFTVFEIEELMAMGDKVTIPVLLYLFRRFEKSLKGQPALLVLDEAWVMLGNPVFREKIREWLKVLRKANCAVVMATQSLSDSVRSGIYDVLLESCPTKILLPNEEADKSGTEDHPGPRDLYAMMGLNETEIDILKTSIKKRHYYYISPEGKRLFDLGLGPIALSFVAVSDKSQLAQIRDLKEMYGSEWPYVWLQRRSVHFEGLLEPKEKNAQRGERYALPV